MLKVSFNRGLEPNITRDKCTLFLVQKNPDSQYTVEKITTLHRNVPLDSNNIRNVATDRLWLVECGPRPRVYHDNMAMLRLIPAPLLELMLSRLDHFLRPFFRCSAAYLSSMTLDIASSF